MHSKTRARLVAFAALLACLLALPVGAANSDIRISSIGYVTNRAKFASVVNAGAAGAFQIRRASNYSIAFSSVLAPAVLDETGGPVGSPAFLPNGYTYDQAYTDDPIIAGTTAIKARHVLELRDAVDALRGRAGLAPIAFTEGTPAAGGAVRASHIIDLRNALNAVLFPNPAYTALAAGGPIRAVHIQELRGFAK